MRLATLYEGQDRLPQARATLESALPAGPTMVPLLTALARVAYKQRDWKGALGYLAHARDLDPGNAAIHFFFGIVCIEMDLPIEGLREVTDSTTWLPADFGNSSGSSTP